MVEENKNLVDFLPASFKLFAEKNGINTEMFYDLGKLEKLPRFIRINPHRPVSLEKIENELKEKLDLVWWIP